MNTTEKKSINLSEMENHQLIFGGSSSCTAIHAPFKLGLLSIKKTHKKTFQRIVSYVYWTFSCLKRKLFSKG